MRCSMRSIAFSSGTACGSMVRTARLLAIHPPLRCRLQPQAGVAAARNIGRDGATPPQCAALREAALPRIGIQCTRTHASRNPAHICNRILAPGWERLLLQKVMGHSALETTKRYAHMTTADLQAVHERVSLLSRW